MNIELNETWARQKVKAALDGERTINVTTGGAPQYQVYGYTNEMILSATATQETDGIKLHITLEGRRMS